MVSITSFKLIKYIIISCIFVLLAVASAIDWSRLLCLSSETFINVSPISNILKFCIVSLATGLAFFAYKKGIDACDERRFRLIFSLILIADICFFINEVLSIMIGIFVFMFAQICLIKRNLTGIKDIADFNKTHLIVVLLISYLIFVILAPLNLASLMTLGVNILTIEIILYSFFLGFSVISALVSFLVIKKLPLYNRLLMLIGLVFFFICDLTVMGTLLSYKNGVINIFTTSSTWMFYAPALLLIALSAYRENKVT